MYECLLYYSLLLFSVGCLRGLTVLLYRLRGREFPEPEQDPEEVEEERKRKEKRKERRNKILLWFKKKEEKKEWKNGEAIC